MKVILVVTKLLKTISGWDKEFHAIKEVDLLFQPQLNSFINGYQVSKIDYYIDKDMFYCWFEPDVILKEEYYNKECQELITDWYTQKQIVWGTIIK